MFDQFNSNLKFKIKDQTFFEIRLSAFNIYAWLLQETNYKQGNFAKLYPNWRMDLMSQRICIRHDWNVSTVVSSRENM